MMKVMFDYQIFCAQKFGGVPRYHIELLKQFEKMEDITSFVSAKYIINKYLCEKCNSNEFVFSENSIIKLWERKRNKYINYVKCIFDARKADIVHVTWTDPYINKFIKGKYIVTIHDMIHELFWSDLPQMQREIENKKKAIFESDAIIAISENTKKDILSFYPTIPEEKIHVVYHGTNHLPKEKVTNQKLPDRYILYVGRRENYKGASLLIEAMSELQAIHNDMNLLFVGGGGFSNEEQELINKYKLQKKIHQFSVDDAELAYLYTKAQCFVCPSIYEGFGFPVLEAMEHNCPCICTNASSLPEVGGEAALYFEANNKNDLIDKLELLISDVNLKNKMIKLGRERVDLFTWEKCAFETLKVYESVVQERKHLLV